MSTERYPDHLTEARGDFKTGGSFQNRQARRTVTDATETARLSQWTREDGARVNCVDVYLTTEDIPDEVREVADHHGLELTHRDGEKLVFVDGGDSEPMGEDPERSEDDGEDASEELSVTAEVNGEVQRDARVEIAAERETDIHDDGRRTVRLSATVDLSGTEFTAPRLRRRAVATGSGGEFVGWVTGVVPGAERERVKVAIRGDDFHRVDRAAQSVSDALDRRREDTLSELDPELETEREWSEGEGEGHAIHAEGSISTADGRELAVHFRNAVDIGFQVFSEDGVDEFSGREVDALISFAKSNSPISTQMRM